MFLGSRVTFDKPLLQSIEDVITKNGGNLVQPEKKTL